MARKRKAKRARARAERMKLTPEESIKRMQDFPKRMEAFIAGIRSSGATTGQEARMKISAEESLRRVMDFPKRREKFIAAIREGKPYIFARKRAKQTENVIIERPKRAKLTREEIRKRMEDFPKRRAEFIAAVRKNKT